jgi:hypothetical protein
MSYPYCKDHDAFMCIECILPIAKTRDNALYRWVQAEEKSRMLNMELERLRGALREIANYNDENSSHRHSHQTIRLMARKALGIESGDK